MSRRLFRGCSLVLLIGVVVSQYGVCQTRLGTDTEAPPQRLALLIGNSTYQHYAALKNPKNDVDQIAARLTELGFQTTVKYDLDHDEFVAAVSDFQNQIEPGAIVLFYYSGHGVQVGGTNYLIPVTMPAAANAATLTGIGIPLSWVRDHVDGARLSLIILDACRTLANIPAKGPNNGLAPFFARGSLIAYAADEGQSASDNDGEDLSLFTKHLIAELRKTDETLCQLFAGVPVAVDEASSHVQFPFIYDGVIGEFVFNRASTGESQQLNMIFNAQGSKKAWAAIQNSDNPNDFAAFLGKESKDKSREKLAYTRLSDLMAITTQAVGVVPLGYKEEAHILAIANQGERLFYERDYARALESYKQLLALTPSQAIVLYDYGTCLLHLGRNDEAIQFFSQAIDVDAEFPWAYYNRGVAEHLKGNLVNAVADYSHVLQRRPKHARGYNNLALAKRQLGKFADADRDVIKSLDLDSYYAPAYFNRATILKNSGNAAAASQAAEKGKTLTLPSQPW